MKKRQKIRKSLILISFFLFPITIFYLSPVMILMGASKGIVTGSMLVFGFLFLSALMLGRLFCGWVCPGGGLQEICFLVQDKRIKRGNWIKYLIWAPWILTIIWLFLKSGGIKKVDPLFQMPLGISVSEPSAYIIYYFFLVLIVILALFVGRRSFCHHLCWMAPFMVLGRKIRNLFNYPSLSLKADSGKCIHCHTCSRNCPMSLDVEHMVETGTMENSECILCGTCIDGCTEQVILYKFKK